MWNKRYKELKEYVAEHGNAVVPKIYSKNQSLLLGFWVAKQRNDFKACPRWLT